MRGYKPELCYALAFLSFQNFCNLVLELQMAKAYEFNWHRPVPDFMLAGEYFDRFDEVSKMLSSYFVLELAELLGLLLKLLAILKTEDLLCLQNAITDKMVLFIKETAQLFGQKMAFRKT